MKRFNNVQDLRRYLASLVNRLDQGEVEPATAGKIGYICSILHRVLLDSDLEARLTALEKKMSNQEVRK